MNAVAVIIASAALWAVVTFVSATGLLFMSAVGFTSSPVTIAAFAICGLFFSPLLVMPWLDLRS